MNNEPTLKGYNIKAQIESRNGQEMFKMQFDSFAKIDEWLAENSNYIVISTERNEVWGF